MKRLLLIVGIVMLTQTLLAQVAPASNPYTSCPDVNIAIARAGTNADITNPYFLYNVNQLTGAMSLVPGGPYRDPLSPAMNLQVNAVGVSKKDGFIYGMAYDGTTTTARFVRLDQSYGVTSLGSIPSPASGGGLIAFVNSAAGEMDTAGNYYFTAVTVAPLPTPSFDKFYLGKISNTHTLTAGGPPTVTYYEVDISATECQAYVSTFLSDPVNSGLKDFSYNARTNSFFSYATYKLPGNPNFSGQLIQLVAIPGSVPQRYRLICSPIVNSHTAETSGTIIDMNGRFTVLFTDGSFGMLNSIAGVYTGTFTMINPATGLPNPLRGDMGSCGQDILNIPPPPPPTGNICPNNYAVVRAGTNADITNPYYIYQVAASDGSLRLLSGGPLLYPGTQTRLQMNGVGVNETDNLIYGMAFEGSLTTARLVKTDTNYNVTLLGNIPPPVSATGPLAFINSAAGDVDEDDNYWFSAATARPGSTPGSIVMDKLYIGVIRNVSTVTGIPSPVYYEIEWQGSPCQDLISSFTTDPINSGIKDFFYHPITKTFFTYATYKLPGDVNFRGQMVELRPIGNPASPDRFKMFCKNVINSHTAETSGTMVVTDGKFMVLLTDGTIGIIPRTGNSFNYSGAYVPLNNSTGLPPVIRGDFGSCVDLRVGNGGNGGNGNNGRPAFTFNMQPNIVQGSTTLRWTFVPQPTTMDVMVLDANGNVVRRIQNTPASTNTSLTIHLNNLSAGIYYIHATDRNTGDTFETRVVKQ